MKIRMAGQLVIFTKAAIKIQKNIRGYLCRSWYQELKSATLKI